MSFDFRLMKITCVIVTYNRLVLLKECVEAVLRQSYPLYRILILDNHSTDETSGYLQTLEDDSKIKIVSLPENIGGAGGFSRGIKEAVLDGADWVWVMDDDTIPNEKALEKMVDATSVTDKIGFLCSKVVWKDGTPHQMNRPGLCLEKGELLFNSFSKENIPAFLVKHASFVSILINSEAVKEVGLPISDFFIWADDMEYTMRIVSKGYHCFYVDNSVVLHKTVANYAPYPDTAPADSAWKFYYHARNVSFLKRKIKYTNVFSFWFSTFNMYRVYLRRISKRKDGKKALFKKCIRKGCWDGLSFNPKIEYLPLDR